MYVVRVHLVVAAQKAIAMSESATYTRLFAAMRDNDLDQFCTDIESQTLPDGCDYDLLVEAMLSDRKDFALALLHSNCKTSKSNTVNTLVHVGLMNGWHDVVEQLLELDAPVSARNSLGDTAVHVAFRKSYSGDIVDCLLGCYLLETTDNAINADGLSILHIACTRPDVELFKKLAYKGNGDGEGEEIALSYGDLNSQVHLDSKSPYAGYTPLHFAVENGCTEIIRDLMQVCHVDICKQNARGSTPLHLALQRRDIEAIDIILANNAVYQDCVNNDGLTHVMAACAGTMTEIANNFLTYINVHANERLKSVVNARVEDPSNPLAGYTPLHFAAEYGRFQTVQILYFFEAAIFAKNAQDLTALVLAVKRNHQYVARLIFNYYKAYRESICDDTRDVVVETETPFIQSPTKTLIKFESKFD